MMVDPPPALPEIDALLRAGRYAEAGAAQRQALDRRPDDRSTAATTARIVALARSWLARGDADKACALLAAIAASAHAGADAWMVHGHALMMLGRKDAAEVVYRRWMAREPATRDAALRLAAVLADNDKAAEAETLVRADIRRHGPSIDAAFVLGRALLDQARFDEAELEFRKVVQARPDHVVAQANLMELVWMRTGDVHAAGRALDRALRSQPSSTQLRLTKVRLLTSARMQREALAEVETGLAAASEDPGLLAAAVTVALDVDGDRAWDYAQRLLQFAPGLRAARVAWANAALATGRGRSALDASLSLQRSDPADGEALAIQADALRILGDSRYRELLDYQGLLRAELLDVPDGWSDLPSYLADLVSDLERSHTLRAHPIGNSLREGSQVTLFPDRSPFASIRAFPRAIDGPIRRYLQALGTGSDPMRRRNTGAYRLRGMWSVRLRPHGFHVNHYHPEGWISSACYLHLPPAVSSPGGEGWLQFGEPAFATRPPLAPEYFLKPVPGLLALFPSYMWHGTLPFSGAPADHRLTIAFDVVPVSE